MARIPSIEERLKKVTTIRDLQHQINDANRTLSQVKLKAKSQLPLELRHVPNAARMIPHLNRDIRDARHVYEALRCGFERYSRLIKTGEPLTTPSWR